MRFCLLHLSKTKVQKIPKVQMEHFQDLIVDPNIIHERKKINWALYDNNIFELLNACPNFTYSK
jgi:3-methyladenine DNA glycosylase Tag